MVGSKPSFAQIFAGSGVPGKGVFVQSANAQSELAIVIFGPSSVARFVRIAFDVSSVAGSWYTTALTALARGNVVAPLGELMKRAVNGPVTEVPSGFFAIGTTMV